jgi:hypothetical protein
MTTRTARLTTTCEKLLRLLLHALPRNVNPGALPRTHFFCGEGRAAAATRTPHVPGRQRRSMPKFRISRQSLGAVGRVFSLQRPLPMLTQIRTPTQADGFVRQRALLGDGAAASHTDP